MEVDVGKIELALDVSDLCKHCIRSLLFELGPDWDLVLVIWDYLYRHAGIIVNVLGA